MGFDDIIAIIFVAAFLTLVIIKTVKDLRLGKTSCSGDCKMCEGSCKRLKSFNKYVKKALK